MIVHKNVLNSFLVNNCRLGRVDINPPSLIFNNNNMALQVWLPLNKSGVDKNQGLANINITSTATYNASGKLGGSYYFSGSSNRISFPSQSWMEPNDTNSISIAMWVKADSFSYIIASEAFEFKLSSSSFMWRLGNGGTNTFSIITSGITFTTGTWYHLCGTWNAENKKLAVYVNGELINEGTSTLTSYNNISSTINLVYGGSWNINDFRFYDHCLSPKEVKEISKGLVLHYPLNSLVNPNLVKNSYFCTNMNNGTVEVVPNVGYVDNTAYYGSPAYHVFREGQTTIAYSEFQFIFRANKCVPGKQYCISFWVKKCHSGGNWGNIILDGLRWFKTGDNTTYTTSITWNNRPSENLLNVWQYASFYFTFPVECTAYAYYYNTVGKDIDYYISKIKVEEGTVSTPWCDYGITNNIVYDCSGYQNNGTISGSLSCRDDSPRYKTSTEFSAGNYIQGSFELIEQSTIVFWLKKCFPSGYLNVCQVRKNQIRSQSWYCGGKNSSYVEHTMATSPGYSSFNTPAPYDGWHQYCLCRNNGIDTFYIDGVIVKDNVLINNSSINEIIVGTISSSTSGTYLISDVRVYATALSEEDIKELYNTSCIINS